LFSRLGLQCAAQQIDAAYHVERSG
jgi:hypothetical protein